MSEIIGNSDKFIKIGADGKTIVGQPDWLDSRLFSEVVDISDSTAVSTQVWENQVPYRINPDELKIFESAFPSRAKWIREQARFHLKLCKLAIDMYLEPFTRLKIGLHSYRSVR